MTQSFSIFAIDCFNNTHIHTLTNLTFSAGLHTLRPSLATASGGRATTSRRSPNTTSLSCSAAGQGVPLAVREKRASTTQPPFPTPHRQAGSQDLVTCR